MFWKKGVATSQVKPHPSSKNLKAKRSSRPLCLSLNKKKSTSSTSSCTKQKQKEMKIETPTKIYSWMEWMFKKTKVILTKIWFFFLIFFFFASWTPLHLAAAVIDIVFSLTFFFQKSMLKKRDNYSVCLNVAIFKNKQKKIPTNLISFIFWFIANPQWNKILWNLVLWLDIKKVDDTTNHLIWI